MIPPPRRPTGRHLLRRVVAGGLLGLVGLLVLGGPAGAVTPRPTDDRSQVTGIEPPGGWSARVVGGDSLMALTVEPGHEVVVEGYGGEPYLRVTTDGSVEVNRNSGAVALNRSRDADVTTAGTAPSTEVDWQPYQSGRTAIWHDHRIHAGSGAELTAPLAWSIPIRVDGQPGSIDGSLEQLSSPSPLPSLALAALVALALLVAGRRRPLPAIALALGGACLVATVTGYLEWQAVPDVVARNAGLFVLPMAAAAATTVGLVVSRRPVRLVALLVAVSLLAGWLAFRWSILTRAVLISDLSPTLDRLGLAFVLGATVAAAGLVVRWAGTAIAPPASASSPLATE